MNLISIGESVFETGDDRVDVIFTHLPDVLEQERHGFETTVSYVEFRCSVFVEDGRDAGERSTGFSDDSCKPTRVSTKRYGRRMGGSIPIATVEQTRD